VLIKVLIQKESKPVATKFATNELYGLIGAIKWNLLLMIRTKHKVLAIQEGISQQLVIGVIFLIIVGGSLIVRCITSVLLSFLGGLAIGFDS
jgi:hypothetical protein